MIARMSDSVVNLGHPQGVALRGLTGADCDGVFLTVFAYGTDDKLWGRAFWIVSKQWEPWVCIGAPPCGLAQGGNTYGHAAMANRLGAWWVYMLGKDGKVWTAIKADVNATAWVWVESPGSVSGGTIQAVWGLDVPSDRLTKAKGPDVVLKMSQPPGTWSVVSYAPPGYFINNPAGGWSAQGFFSAPPVATGGDGGKVLCDGFNKARQLVQFQFLNGDVVADAAAL